LASQVLIRELTPGTAFIHVQDEGSDPQPERVFRVVAFRKNTAVVENGVGVRTSMSKKTQVVPMKKAA